MNKEYLETFSKYERGLIISPQSLAPIMPENMKIIPMIADVQTEIKQARIGVELWRYFLYAVIVLLIFEMILSNAKKQR